MLMLIKSSSLEQTTMMAIDPGLNNTGIAIYELDLVKRQVISINAWTIKAERLVDHSGLDDDDYMERVHKRYSLVKAIQATLEEYNPTIVVSESPFFDRRKPSSFAVLTEVMVGIFDCVARYNPAARFSVVEPQAVKQALGVAGQKGKEIVREAVSKELRIMEHLQTPLLKLDEHGVDAVGVGFSFLLRKYKFYEVE